MKYTDFLTSQQWVKDAIDDPNDLTPSWILTIKDGDERSQKLHELCKQHYAEIKIKDEELERLRRLLRGRGL